MRDRQKGHHSDIDRDGYAGPKAEGCALVLMLLAVPVLLVIALTEWIIKGGEHLRDRGDPADP